MKRLILFPLLFALWFCGAGAAEPAGGYAITNMVARGVYWPWEMTNDNAAAAGMEKWQFVEQVIQRLSTDYACNLIWFVNGPDDPKKVLSIAQKYKVTVLLGADFFRFYYHGGIHPESIARAADQSVERYRDSPAFGGYVLKDEALRKDFSLMESLRSLLTLKDPAHPSIIVTMTGDTEVYARRSGFPVICTDIYHFGGPGSRHIPNPASNSQGCYRRTVEALNALTRDKKMWVMPQAFTEIWGASSLDEQGNVVIEPGAYWHWRMPTPEEVRWQSWETIRAGGQGVVFFALMLDRAEPWKPGMPLPEKIQKRMERNKEEKLPLTQKQINTKMPRSLLSLGGRETRQIKAMADSFATFAKLEALILHWTPSACPAVFAEKPGNVNCFQLADQNYAVIVNDDLQAERKIRLSCLPVVEKITDLATAAVVPMFPPEIDADGLICAEVTLPAGGGAIVALTMKTRSIGVVDEDFSGSALTVKLEHAVVRKRNAAFGMGHYQDVCPDRTIADITNKITPNAFVIVDGLADKLGKYSAPKDTVNSFYLVVDAVANNPEDLVVQLVDKDGKEGWNKTDHYGFPLRIPSDTREIRLKLAADASIQRIRILQAVCPSVPVVVK